MRHRDAEGSTPRWGLQGSERRWAHGCGDGRGRATLEPGDLAKASGIARGSRCRSVSSMKTSRSSRSRSRSRCGGRGPNCAVLRTLGARLPPWIDGSLAIGGLRSPLRSGGDGSLGHRATAHAVGRAAARVSVAAQRAARARRLLGQLLVLRLRVASPRRPSASAWPSGSAGVSARRKPALAWSSAISSRPSAGSSCAQRRAGME